MVDQQLKCSHRWAAMVASPGLPFCFSVPPYSSPSAETGRTDSSALPDLSAC